MTKPSTRLKDYITPSSCWFIMDYNVITIQKCMNDYSIIYSSDVKFSPSLCVNRLKVERVL